MRTGLVALLLVAPLLSGCLSFLDDETDPDAGRTVAPARDVDDPAQIQVTGVKVHGGLDPREALTIPGHGNVSLSALIYEPLTQQAMPDGSAPTFPVVVFLHGFGLTKEMWTCPPMGDPAAPAPEPGVPCPYEDLLQRFAEAGFITVAFDTRGFGQSGGQVGVVDAAELADLRAVIDYVEERFDTNGKIGLTGISYGGGYALMGLATDPRVTTAVPHQGWYDLYEGLLPGNVPKAEWAALLLGEGTIGSAGALSPKVYDWATNGLQRTDLAGIKADLDQRSVARYLGNIDRPLMFCQGMQESLFPQVDQLWQAHPGFSRAIVHQGGHGTLDPECWDDTLEWFEFFLRGVDTGVDTWPALRVVDMDGSAAISIQDYPSGSWQDYYLREPQLTQYAPSGAEFDIQNQLLNNPLQEPAAVWDLTGQANQAIPYSMRDDPTAVFFESEAFVNSQVVLGAPVLELALADEDPGAFQVTAQLLHVDKDGNSRILSRGAYAYVPGVTEAPNGTATLRMHFTKAEIEPTEQLVLKVAANDASWFAPFTNGNDPASSQYTVTFTGHSQLHVPFF